MATSEFKTAAAKLLDQQGVKNVAAEVMQAEVQAPAEAKKTAFPQPKKIPITVPLIFSLMKTRMSLGLAVGCCALMWLVVPELLIPKSFKIFNAVLGIIIGLTYGIILAFPHSGEGGDKL